MNRLVILTLTFVFLQTGAKIYSLKRDATENEAKTCIRELNLDEAEITEIKRHFHSPEDNPDYITFMECSWRKKGFLLEDGNINYNATRQMIVDIFEEGFSPEFSESIADSAFSNCNNIQGTSPGQKVIKMENCLLVHLKEFFQH